MKVYTISKDSNYVAYIPIKPQKIHFVLASDTDKTIPQVVNVFISVKRVRESEIVMIIPISKSTFP